MNSGHEFPVFLSSTIRDLVDLRAGLTRHLTSLGYKPIGSDCTGFPGSSDELEPHEVCLKALERCFVAIFVIDARGGTPVTWPHYNEVFKGKTVSPTHGELLYARHIGMRSLVFVRERVWESYCEARNDRPERGRAELKKPRNSEDRELGVITLLDEITEMKPQLWCHRFRNVTDLASEVQRQLVNMLAELFQAQGDELALVATAFNKRLAALSEPERRKALEEVDAIRNLKHDLDRERKEKVSLANKLSTLEQRLAQAQECAEVNEQELQSQQRKLQEQLQKAQESTDETFQRLVECEQTSLYYAPDTSYVPRVGCQSPQPFALSSLPNPCDFADVGPICGGCGCVIPDQGAALRTCTRCFRTLCTACWPLEGTALEGACIECGARWNQGSLSLSESPPVE